MCKCDYFLLSMYSSDIYYKHLNKISIREKLRQTKSNPNNAPFICNLYYTVFELNCCGTQEGCGCMNRDTMMSMHAFLNACCKDMRVSKCGCIFSVSKSIMIFSSTVKECPVPLMQALIMLLTWSLTLQCIKLRDCTCTISTHSLSVGYTERTDKG